MKFNSTIAGIPCIVHVTRMTKYEPANEFEPESGGDFEYELLTRKGQKADWLTHKITRSDTDRFYKEALNILDDEWNHQKKRSC